MTDLAIIESTDHVISIMPSAQETAKQAIERQLALVGVIQTLIDATFDYGVDFGKIDGVDKDTLFLPGIEKTMGLLGLRESFRDIHTERQFDSDNPFFYFEVECVLTHSQSGLEVATGQGVCHTREKSFMRREERTCPNCEQPAIIKGKVEYGGGWLCWNKKGGCGAKFQDGDQAIEGQSVGMINDPQLVWDGLNRARKIANKRAKADAVKRIGMLSGRFTVDVEDFTADLPDSKSEDTDIRGTNGNAPQGNLKHWTEDGKQVARFYSACKQLQNAPTSQTLIFEALDIQKISEYTGTYNEALQTVTDHMVELERMASTENNTEKHLKEFSTQLLSDRDIKAAGYNNFNHILNALKQYDEPETLTFNMAKDWLIDRKSDTVYGKTPESTQTAENSQNGDKPTSMDDIPF